MAQTRASISSTLSEDNLPRESQVDGAQVSRIQEGTDQTDKLSTSSEDESLRKNVADRTQASHLQVDDRVFRQSENPESQGVLYCEVDTENGFPIKTADGEKEGNTLTTTEEH